MAARRRRARNSVPGPRNRLSRFCWSTPRLLIETGDSVDLPAVPYGLCILLTFYFAAHAQKFGEIWGPWHARHYYGCTALRTGSLESCADKSLGERGETSHKRELPEYFHNKLVLMLCSSKHINHTSNGRFYSLDANLHAPNSQISQLSLTFLFCSKLFYNGIRC